MSHVAVPVPEGYRPVAILVVLTDEQSLTSSALTVSPSLSLGIGSELVHRYSAEWVERNPLTDDDHAYLAFAEAGAVALTTDDPEDGE